MAEKKGRWRCFLCGQSKRGTYAEWDLHYRSYHYMTLKEREELNANRHSNT